MLPPASRYAAAETPSARSRRGGACCGALGALGRVSGLAGSLARKGAIPVTAGTLPTHGPLFVALLVGTIVLVGALTFLPALAVGPIVEHVQMSSR